jgi:hypothetical protein
VFTVTLLAVFLLGLLFFRAPIHGYLAGSAISVRLVDCDGLSDEQVAEAIRGELVSDQRLRRAAESAGRDANAPLEPLRDAISVRLEPADSLGYAILDVSYLGSDRQEAVQLVERLAADYACSIQDRQQQAAAETSQRVVLARAREREDAAAAARDAFLTEHLDTLTIDSATDASHEPNSADPSAGTGTASSGSSNGESSNGESSNGESSSDASQPKTPGDTVVVRDPNDATVSEPSIIVRVYPDDSQSASPANGLNAAVPRAETAPPMVVNPDWMLLQQQAAALEKQRTDLLADYTSAHPLVRRIDDEIRQISRQIERTPRFVQAPESSGDAGRAASNAGGGDHKASANQADAERRAAAQRRAAEVRKELAALTQAYLAAQVERQRQEQTLANRRAAETALVRDAHMAGAAQLVGRLGGTPSRVQLALLGLVAAIAAGAVSLMVGKPLKAGVFYRVEDVQQRLAVPVVACLPTGDGPPLPVAGRARQWASSLVTTCELTLAVVVIGFVLVALVQSEVTQQFTADPLGSIGEAVTQVTTTLR